MISLNSVLLPAPFGPMTAEDLALLDVEADVVDGDQAAEALGQVLDLEQAHSAASRHPRRAAIGGTSASSSPPAARRQRRLRMPFGSHRMTAIITTP